MSASVTGMLYRWATRNVIPVRRPARPGRYRMPGRMIKSSGYGQKGASVAAPRIRNDNLEYVEEGKIHPHDSRASRACVGFGTCGAVGKIKPQLPNLAAACVRSIVAGMK